MQGLTIIGVDLAKNVFEINGANASGKTLFRKRLKREELAEFFANLPSCTVAMEACGGAHHFGRMLLRLGHEPKMIAAQHVKPFKKTSQKNDRNDAQAIVEAALRPSMNFVAVKPIRNQDLQSLHRVRQQLIDTRVAMVNQIRGLLLEYGIVMDESYSKFKAQIADALEDGSTELTPVVRSLILSMYQLLKQVAAEEESVDLKLKSLAKEDEDCRRLMQVPGVGINSATLFMASIGSPEVFSNGRHVAAWLGLVPRQMSSGETQRNLGITKTGDNQLRAMLINGARSAVLSAVKKQRQSGYDQWILRLVKEKGWNKATVAVANKNTRVMFQMYRNKTEYKVS